MFLIQRLMLTTNVPPHFFYQPFILTLLTTSALLSPVLSKLVKLTCVNTVNNINCTWAHVKDVYHVSFFCIQEALYSLTLEVAYCAVKNINQ